MTICGTKEYTAPEMHFQDEYTSGIDMFSLGMVFVEVNTLLGLHNWE
jgi:serine/threonine protein kinase